MANQELVEILSQGAAAWNTWRVSEPNVPIDLSKVDMPNIELEGANLIGADLRGANLENANLRRALLIGADLVKTNLQGADLSRAHLWKADLQSANLESANLRGANFRGALFDNVNLLKADFSDSLIGWTIFGGLDFRGVRGLDTVQYQGPCILGIDTLYKSSGDIPESFLRGCGAPDSMIEYALSLVLTERSVDYYSVFISYSSEDEAVAKRLHADLQAAGVRCWFAPVDLHIGEPILSGIDRGIRLHDKLLLILSSASVKSAWIEQEVQVALAREQNEHRRVLFPIRIDDAVSAQTAGWPALLWTQRHVGDFRQWKDHDAYQQAFQRLLHDLKAG